MDNASAMRQTIFIVLHHQRLYQLNRGQILQVKIFFFICTMREGFDLNFTIINQGLQVRSRPRRQRTTSINLTTTITPSESIIRANNRTIYTAGRPPWYNCAGQQVEPFVIG